MNNIVNLNEFPIEIRQILAKKKSLKKSIKSKLQYLIINLKDYALNDTQMLSIFKYLNTTLLKISLGYLNSWKTLESYFFYTPNLTYLKLSGIADFNENAVDLIANNLINLQSINFGSNKVTDECLKKLTKLKWLNSLEITWSIGYTDSGVYYFVKKANNLVCFEAQSERSEVVGVKNRTLETICKRHSQSIEKLSLNTQKLTDDAFKFITLCQNLKSISFKGSNNLTDGFLIYLNKLKNIESITLTKFDRLNSNLFFPLNGFKYLTIVNFKRCTISDNFLELLPNRCSNLQDLTLNNCFGFTDKGLSLLFSNCNNLRAIDLSFCSFLKFRAFEKVPHVYLKKIEIIVIQNCKIVS